MLSYVGFKAHTNIVALALHNKKLIDDFSLNLDEPKLDSTSLVKVLKEKLQSLSTVDYFEFG